MALMDVAATKDNRKVTVQFDFGDTIEDVIRLWGGDVTYRQFIMQSKISIQAFVRRQIEAGLNDEEIQNRVDDWKPGMVAERVSDPIALLKRKIQGATPEEKKAMAEEIKKVLAGD